MIEKDWKNEQKLYYFALNFAFRFFKYIMCVLFLTSESDGENWICLNSLLVIVGEPGSYWGGVEQIECRAIYV